MPDMLSQDLLKGATPEIETALKNFGVYENVVTGEVVYSKNDYPAVSIIH